MRRVLTLDATQESVGLKAVKSLKFVVCFVVLAVLPGQAAAQVQSFMAEGNLEPTQDLGCVGFDAAGPQVTAADLALASSNCIAAKKFDLAVESFIAMQVFGVFDTQRVADLSSHQAVAVMGSNIAAAMSGEASDRFQIAVKKFGGEQSEQHIALCAHMAKIGAPTYHPVYMIQHGQGAILFPDEDPLIEGFDAALSWNAVLTQFLKCN